MLIITRTIFFATVLSILASCQSNKLAPSEIIGSWTIQSFEVKFNDGVIFTVSPDDWRKKMGVQPITLEFNSDSTYIETEKYYNGKTAQRIEGHWSIKDDALVMRTIYEFKLNQVEKTEEGMIITCSYDVNNDMKNEQYQAVLIRNTDNNQ